MKIYDLILEGHEATLEEAIKFARGIDWQEVEKTENENLPYLDYEQAINGIEIWYCYAGDFYIFTDERDD